MFALLKYPPVSFAVSIFVAIWAGHNLEGSAPNLLPWVTWGTAAAALLWGLQLTGYEPTFLARMRNKVVQGHQSIEAEAKAAPVLLRPDPNAVKTALEESVFGQDHLIALVYNDLARTVEVPTRNRPILSLCLGGPSGHGKDLFCRKLAKGIYGDEDRIRIVRPNTFQEDFAVALATMQGDAQFVLVFDEIDRANYNKEQAIDLLKGFIEKGDFELNGTRYPTTNLTVVATLSGAADGDAIGRIAQNRADVPVLRTREIRVLVQKYLSGATAAFDIVDGIAFLDEMAFSGTLAIAIEDQVKAQGLELAIFHPSLNSAVYLEAVAANNVTPKFAALWASKYIPKAVADFTRTRSDRGAGLRVDAMGSTIDGEVHVIIVPHSDDNIPQPMADGKIETSAPISTQAQPAAPRIQPPSDPSRDLFDEGGDLVGHGAAQATNSVSPPSTHGGQPPASPGTSSGPGSIFSPY